MTAKPLVLALLAALAQSGCSGERERAVPLSAADRSSILEAGRSDTVLSPALRRAIIEDLIARLNVAYVFPDVAQRMDSAIRVRVEGGDFDSISTGRELAESLTAELRAESRVLHLLVHFSPEPVRYLSLQDRQDRAGRMNYGIGTVDVLGDNVGYIELRGFYAMGEGVEKAVAAAMDRVSETDALIVDLRANRGAEDLAMSALLVSYLLEPKRTHLTTVTWRLGERDKDYRSSVDLRGERYGRERPVYLLTSRETISGAEEFAYTLKALGRATIVGERTAGAAHWTGTHVLTDHLMARIPFGRPVSAITGSNWEGEGVTPDVRAPPSAALRMAHELAVLELTENRHAGVRE